MAFKFADIFEPCLDLSCRFLFLFQPLLKCSLVLLGSKSKTLQPNGQSKDYSRSISTSLSWLEGRFSFSEAASEGS